MKDSHRGCLKWRIYIPLEVRWGEGGAFFTGDVPFVEFMYPVHTPMPAESDHR